MRNHLASRFEDFCPSHLITVTLHHLSAIPRRHGSEYQSSRDNDLFREIMNRLDRAIHGRKHHRMPEADKFRFIYRLETRSRRNRKTPPHVHILLELTTCDERKFGLNTPDFIAATQKIVWQLGFRPNIDIRRHSAGFNDYILKYPLHDLQNIHWERTRGPR